MLKNLCYSVALAAGLCAPLTTVWANDAATEQNQAKSVIVSGTGSTRELALNNAFRHAVEQAVGMMVSSESYVKNLKEIEDKIIVDSSGFIENYKILKEGRMSSEYGITLSAVVRERKLQTAVTETTGSTKPLNGGSLFANQMLREEKIKLYQKTYVEFLDGLITNGLEFSYDGEPEIKKQSDELYTIVLKNLKIHYKKEWLANLDKYREIFIDASIYNESLNNFREVQWIFGELANLHDQSGQKIHTVPMDRNVRNEINIVKIIGIFAYSNYKYPNISENERNIAGYGNFEIKNLSGDLVSKVNSISFQTFKMNEYGDAKMPRGRLQVYDLKY